ncbi:hypothetical protein CRU98_07255 [Arcobacter sp. CECT 8986]|uniref:hypothetical protein n=1 Tax=Arcobacter sp. CECT 8986 TaxID=2044507 RepID=UPI001009E822|nr:hypothetical protein [Arcobacter sp. CECT 8986]RXJ99153.1 hypothetical protein CRU98_07255 [Arcobacter sp. CECT 8986]
MSENELIKEIINQLDLKDNEQIKTLNSYLVSKHSFSELTDSLKEKIKDTIFRFIGIEVDIKNIKTLNLLKKVIFERCSFYLPIWDYINFEIVFYNCNFINPICIRNIYMLENNQDFLFNECTFPSRVEIENTIISASLFKNCDLNLLYAVSCEFKKKIFDNNLNQIHNNENLNKNKDYTFYDCTIDDEFKIEKSRNSFAINFISCDFLSSFLLDDLDIRVLRIDNNRFFNSCYITLCNINTSTIFKSIFKGVFSCSFNKFINNINLIDIEFENNVSFLSTEFNFYLKPLSCNFNKVVSFKDSILKGIDLEKSNLLGKSNFNNIRNLSEENISEKEVLNRETARIIKDSFEQQNNIIEANKYYAIEMKKREEELTKDLKEGKNFFEWLVFKVHGISSNHSQDWLLALFWIMSFTFSIGTITNHFEEYHISFINLIPAFFIFIMSLIIASLEIEFKNILLIIFGFISYGLYSIISCDFNLYNVTNHINPFSVMNSWDNITFSEFIFKVIIAYLIYQLIISIRQNTRRK